VETLTLFHCRAKPAGQRPWVPLATIATLSYGVLAGFELPLPLIALSAVAVLSAVVSGFRQWVLPDPAATPLAHRAQARC
jgi:hypothetical protein